MNNKTNNKLLNILYKRPLSLYNDLYNSLYQQFVHMATMESYYFDEEKMDKRKLFQYNIGKALIVSFSYSSCETKESNEYIEFNSRRKITREEIQIYFKNNKPLDKFLNDLIYYWNYFDIFYGEKEPINDDYLDSISVENIINNILAKRHFKKFNYEKLADSSEDLITTINNIGFIDSFIELSKEIKTNSIIVTKNIIEQKNSKIKDEINYLNYLIQKNEQKLHENEIAKIHYENKIKFSSKILGTFSKTISFLTDTPELNYDIEKSVKISNDLFKSKLANKTTKNINSKLYNILSIFSIELFGYTFEDKSLQLFDMLNIIKLQCIEQDRKNSEIFWLKFANNIDKILPENKKYKEGIINSAHSIYQSFIYEEYIKKYNKVEIENIKNEKNELEKKQNRKKNVY